MSIRTVADRDAGRPRQDRRKTRARNTELPVIFTNSTLDVFS